MTVCDGVFVCQWLPAAAAGCAGANDEDDLWSGAADVNAASVHCMMSIN